MQSLQPFHTFNIPANAREIIEATSIKQIQQAWQKAQAENLPVLFLGQGSNMLFLEDFQGVVIVNRLSGIQHTEDSEMCIRDSLRSLNPRSLLQGSRSCLLWHKQRFFVHLHLLLRQVLRYLII